MLLLALLLLSIIILKYLDYKFLLEFFKFKSIFNYKYELIY